MVVDSGDTIDTGGNNKIWDIMYKHRESLKTLQYVAVPGNHEYYVNGTGQYWYNISGQYRASVIGANLLDKASSQIKNAVFFILVCFFCILTVLIRNIF